MKRQPYEPCIRRPAAERALLREVADRHGLDVATLTGRRQPKALHMERAEGMGVLYDRLDYSTRLIGTIFSGRDHTTVLHHVRKYMEALDV